MAEMPVERQEVVPKPQLPGTDFLKGALGMPVVRQVTLLFALAASVALAMFAFNWMQTPDFKPLGTSFSPAETNDIVSALEAEQMDYRLDPNTGMVLVPGDEIYAARMLLAGADVLSPDQLGYELLDEEQGFGVSQYMEIARHRRSVEGELARSISTITSIAHARVLLATPKTTAFLRDRRKPSASVTVTLKPGRALTREQTRGITNLVAAAVPELKSADVVVVDQTGALLSDGADDAAARRNQEDLAYARQVEGDIHDKVVNILGPWVGADRFTAQVSASLNFTRSERTEETYNPDLTALRSEERHEEQKRGGEDTVGGIPGTLTNQPPEFATADGAEEADTKATEQSSSMVRSTRNFEVDRAISHTLQQVGTMQRLSVAVIVDDRIVTDAESGEVSVEAWSEDDIANMTLAIQGAVGYDEARGDTVSVVNRTFYRAPEVPIEATPFWAEGWFSDLLKQVLGGIALILVVFGLLRPMFKNLSQAGEMVREQQSLAIADLTQVREAAIAEAVPGLPSPIEIGPSDTSADKMETVRNLIAEDPNRVAQVIKHWVSEDE